MTSEQPRQHRDAMRQNVDDIPEGAHPTIDTPIHGDRRPVAVPLLLTVGLIVIILVVMLAIFTL